MRIVWTALLMLATGCISAPPDADPPIRDPDQDSGMNDHPDEGLEPDSDMNDQLDEGLEPPFLELSQRFRVDVPAINGIALTEFVFPIRLSELDLEENRPFFVTLDDETRIPSVLADGAIWVRLPEFGEVQSIWVNVLAAGAVDMQDDAQSVWTGYSGVWHFSEIDFEADSSSSSAEMRIDAEVGSDVGLVGNSVSIPDGMGPPVSEAMALSAESFPGTATIEFWTQVDITEQRDSNFLFGGGQSNYLEVFGGPDDEGHLRFLPWVDGQSDLHVGRVSGYPLNKKDEFVHVAIVLDGPNRNAWIYFDGTPGSRVNSGENVVELPPGWTANGQKVAFGGKWNGGGRLDEARMSPLVRSQSYLRATTIAYQPNFVEITAEEL